ncbi:MAG TPA: TraB/GumN family protein [Saprospiraceae bacterium]|nr:TraB/GumN family protein [Saprospiraceae bacterium]HRG21919.1 TraB/GumN family protein [Saprospiraceae bacterium]
MRSSLIWAFLGLLLLGFGSCKTSQKTYTPLEKSLLWEISGPGIKQPSYLYGTIHMIPSDDYFLPKGTLSAIEASQNMVFEIDMKDMSDVSALFGMMGKIFMKDGVTLKTLLTTEEYQLVENHFKDMGLPIFFLERIKPMFLSAFATSDMNPNSLKDGSIKSYEMEFYEISQDRNMTTGGLETIDFQVSVFDSIPYKEQAKMLVESLKTLDEDNGELDKLVSLYKAQDIDAMVNTMSSENSELAPYEDILLNGRNKTWIPQIIQQAKLQTTFFAVGAGHLAGSNGVIHLLRKEGYKVKPVK